MLSQLKIVLLMHFVGVYSQTCYTECLKEATGDTTIVNIIVLDDISDPVLPSYQGWLDRKIMEFNDLYPGIFVVPIHVKYEDMVSDAMELESGMKSTMHTRCPT